MFRKLKCLGGRGARFPVLFFMLAAGLGLATSCVKDQPQPTYRSPPILYFRTDFKVSVQPANARAGPNYLVHFYLSPDAFDRRVPFRSEITDTNGEARFSNLRVGEGYVDCTVPGRPNRYDSTYVVLFGDTNVVYELNLR